ncbi:MAG: diphthamide biosynthesis enzyme Dph2 [Desulfurococcales archaeon]|nr:diphthamide biosynthesis enzyme Dph2 [Desulfurococcales archaeon]
MNEGRTHSMPCDDIPYEIDFKPIEEKIKASRRILIQGPDGLKPFMPSIVGCLKGLNSSAKVYIDAASLYGACDLHLEVINSVNPDLIIHLGHNEYPRSLGYQKDLDKILSKVAFIPAYSKARINETVVSKLSNELAQQGFKKVSLTAVIQHANLIEQVKKMLEHQGFGVYVPRPAYKEMFIGQVLGCEYSAITLAEKLVDAHIVIAGGLFHVLGASLSASKPVYKLDPYRQEYMDMHPLRERYLKKRLYRVYKAMDSRTYGLIVGSKTGQSRKWLENQFIRLLQRHGKSYIIYVADQLNTQVLGNIDTSNIDAFIVTSCPRLPIDDLEDYPKPVLTPGEAIMAITGKIDRYIFPW